MEYSVVVKMNELPFQATIWMHFNKNIEEKMYSMIVFT